MIKDFKRFSSREDSPNREAPNSHSRGSKKYKEMVHKKTKELDKYRNLPFQFSKPPKRTQRRRDVYFQCANCDEVHAVNKYTKGIVCGNCKSYQSVVEDRILNVGDQ